MQGLKKLNGLISLLLIVAAIWWAFSSQLPSAEKYQSNNDKEFSQKNALKHLKVISEKPHFVGSVGHGSVRRYLVTEIQKMGLFLFPPILLLKLKAFLVKSHSHLCLTMILVPIPL